METFLAREVQMVVFIRKLMAMVSLFFIIFVVVSCGNTQTTPEIVKQEVTIPVTVEVTREVTVEVLREITVIVTKVVTATPTPKPSPTPTPEGPKLGTRANPYPAQEWVEIKDGGQIVKMRLVRTARGKEAKSIVNEGNDFLISTPGDGKEFFLAYFEVEYVQGEDSEDAFGTSSDEFFVSANNELLSGAIVVFGKDVELQGVIYPGGSLKGWVPFIIPEGAEVQGVAFGDVLEPEVWFAVQ